MREVAGAYYAPCAAEARQAKLIFDDGALRLIDQQGQLLARHPFSDCQFEDSLTGVKAEVTLPDGSFFQAQDTAFDWPKGLARGRSVTWLESHLLTVILAVILAPLLLFLAYWYLIPVTAATLVKITPVAAIKYLDEQSLTLLEATVLEPTKLTEQQQANIKQQFASLLRAADIDDRGYQLLLYQSDYFGANAVALAGGTLIITDGLVQVLEPDPDAMSAVMLHEVGHVQQQHAIRAISRSAAATVFLTFVFQDIEAGGELLIGSSGTLFDLAYSRDMERQADAFAVRHLQRLGLPSTALRQALQTVAPSAADDSNPWLEYLATHPTIEARGRAANK